jgi:hypothetical protein
VTQSGYPGGFGGVGSYFGQVLVQGSEWLGGHGVDVYWNGCSGCGSSTYGKYGWEWQCVELFERLINVEKWFEGNAGAGIEGADELFNAVPASAFEKHPNGSGYIPVPGDAVIFGGDTYGHVAIVEKVANGRVDLVAQNASPTGRESITINGSTLGDDYNLYVIGVLHAKANTSSHEGPELPEKLGPAVIGEVSTSGQFDVKEGVSGTWTEEAGGVKSIAIAPGKSGPVIGEVSTSGQFDVKEGVSGTWTEETGGVASIAIAQGSNGPVIGEVSTSGQFDVKEGVSGTWTEETGGVASIAITS